jgi:hypothetical protein
MHFPIVLSSFLVSASALSIKSTPIPPSKDPWYTAPKGFEYAAPGSILRIRNAPGNLTSIIGNSSAAYNILYRTTDSNYQPTFAVTTLFIPKNPQPALVSIQVPYNSPFIDSSPSYAAYQNPSLIGLVPAVLGNGWYAAVPDFEGPLAAFGAGVIEGHATLDGIRAVLYSDKVPKNISYGMGGYSGGSIATEFAAELSVQYAPELKIAAAAIGGVVSNATDALVTVNRGPFAQLFVQGLLGITKQDKPARDFVISQLKTTGPYNKTTFLAADNLTEDEAIPIFQGQDIFNYFTNGSAFLQAPVIKQLTNRDGLMGYHGVPEFPLFVYKAVNDEVTPIASTDRLVDRYCEVGANIVYQRNTIGGHVSDFTFGTPPAFEWIAGIFAGNTVDGCTIQNVTLGDGNPV